MGRANRFLSQADQIEVFLKHMEANQKFQEYASKRIEELARAFQAYGTSTQQAITDIGKMIEDASRSMREMSEAQESRIRNLALAARAATSLVPWRRWRARRALLRMAAGE